MKITTRENRSQLQLLTLLSLTSNIGHELYAPFCIMKINRVLKTCSSTRDLIVTKRYSQVDSDIYITIEFSYHWHF